ncbi:MAG: hypothetical protein KJ569_03245 [Candidatus Omnitrophica bacterium]|nr:hypothetical protein [Candidatus Omnitrophota bacterium]MBU1524479.1 hypothetical protein [Candidatus Omnitrophota bacterium]MBU2504728.1 hypothetical protein [Candidatus Omnitrophota bacterium]
MKECNLGENKAKCNCTYEPCARKGVCCECIKYHLSAKQLPACFFSAQDERTYDRSINKFIQTYQKNP